MPNLTTKPNIVTRPAAPFLYIEKIGPFMKTAPGAWQEFWGILGQSFDTKNMTAMMGLSHIDKVKKGDEAYTYQAGITLAKELPQVPAGLKQRQQKSGKYASFILTGSYSQLGDTYPLAYKLLAENNLTRRDDFAMEVYINTPGTVTEDQLKTEILIPVD